MASRLCCGPWLGRFPESERALPRGGARFRWSKRKLELELAPMVAKPSGNCVDGPPANVRCGQQLAARQPSDGVRRLGLRQGGQVHVVQERSYPARQLVLPVPVAGPERDLPDAGLRQPELVANLGVGRAPLAQGQDLFAAMDALGDGRSGDAD